MAFIPGFLGLLSVSFCKMNALTIFALVLCSAVYLILSHRSRRGRLPGPKGWPIIGNVLDMPSSHEWLTFSKWAYTFGREDHCSLCAKLTDALLGDIVVLDIFRQRIVLLNSVEQAVNLLEKRSATYSDRPQLVLACEMVGWDKTLSLMPYGDVWRSVRKYFHNIVGSRELGKFLPMIENESSKLLISLLRQPQDFPEHVRRCVMSCLLATASEPHADCPFSS